MHRTQNYPQSDLPALLPIAGALLFAALYVCAAHLYPGGSEAEPAARGFSWVHNYWCNLLNERAVNGAPNAARPVAFCALVVLSATLGFFWWRFPSFAGFRQPQRIGLQAAGLLSMAFSFFLPTIAHDVVVQVAGAFGLLALAGTYRGLHRLRWQGLLRAGYGVLLLVLLNNILYYGPGWRLALPLVQKLTFVAFLAWMSAICLRMSGAAGVREMPGGGAALRRQSGRGDGFPSKGDAREHG